MVEIFMEFSKRSNNLPFFRLCGTKAFRKRVAGYLQLSNLWQKICYKNVISYTFKAFKWSHHANKLMTYFMMTFKYNEFFPVIIMALWHLLSRSN